MLTKAIYTLQAKWPLSPIGTHSAVTSLPCVQTVYCKYMSDSEFSTSTSNGNQWCSQSVDWNVRYHCLSLADSSLKCQRVLATNHGLHWKYCCHKTCKNINQSCALPVTRMISDHLMSTKFAAPIGSGDQWQLTNTASSFKLIRQWNMVHTEAH